MDFESRNFINYQNNRKEQWRIIVFHISCMVLLVSSGLILDTTENVFLGYSLFL